MGKWEFVREFLGMPRVQTAQFSETTYRPLAQVIYEANHGGISGDAVSRKEAIAIPAVFQGMRLLSSIATLPLEVRDRNRKVVRRPLLEQIDPNVANSVTMAQTVHDLFLHGRSWWRVLALGSDGFPSSAEHLDFSIVHIQPPSDGRSPSPLPDGTDPRRGVVYVDGRPVPKTDVIRFDSLLPPLLDAGRRAIRRATKLSQVAETYAENPRPLDFFSPIEGADPADDDEVKDLLRDWRLARQQGSTAYIPVALKYNIVETMSPADMQIVQQLQQIYLELSNAMGLDPEDLGISTTSRTYQNDVSRRQDRVNNFLLPYMTAIEQRLSMGDVTPRGQRVRFDMDEYLRPDPKTRAEVDKIRLESGTTTRDEIREAENMPDLPEPTTQVTPASVTPIRPAGVTAASDRTTLALSADEVTFTTDVPLHSFNVDGRTITGLALPYNEIALKGGRRYRFLPGALKFEDITRVKLLREHDWSQALGYAMELSHSEDPPGVVMRFKVARGPLGDRALALAEDKVLDGLSIGVAFDDIDTSRDPSNPNVILVHRADLREVSLTPKPAFDNSRVITVTASRDERSTMDDATTEQTAPAAPAVAPVTFTADQMAALMQHNVGIHNPQPQTEQRAVVDPTRQTAVTLTSEPAPYRFDREGNIRRGTHEFSVDLFQAYSGDRSAYDRALSFISDRISGSMLQEAQFDVQTGDVAALNPVINRPDLYVDQLDYQTPVWNAIRKGTVNEITREVVPKFSASSGLVGEHVEGTEPTGGAVTATSQNIDKVALSGKVHITREVWDQGGSPATSNIIWRQMLRAWNEGLEERSVDLLASAACTGTGSVLAAGLVDKNLDGALTSFLSGLQFERGGFRYRDFVLHKALYQALANARDDDGRKLFPAIGPANATGTASAFWNALNINGLAGVPAWALETSASAYASSYLFDREDVYAVATPPQRLEFAGSTQAGAYAPVAFIDLAVWGYFGGAVLRDCGPIEVMYDPT